MVGHGGSSAGSYLADPTSPIPSHCAVIILFKSVAVHQLPWLALRVLKIGYGCFTASLLYVSLPKFEFCAATKDHQRTDGWSIGEANQNTQSIHSVYKDIFSKFHRHISDLNLKTSYLRAVYIETSQRVNGLWNTTKWSTYERYGQCIYSEQEFVENWYKNVVKTQHDKGSTW